MDTNSLSKHLMNYFKASDNKSPNYKQNLAILVSHDDYNYLHSDLLTEIVQRKFFRVEDNPRQLKSFYTAFKQWKTTNYQQSIDWNSLLQDQVMPMMICNHTPPH